MPRCKSPKCQAEINWLETTAGRSIPLDPGRRFVTTPLPEEKNTVKIITRDGDAISGTEVSQEHAKILREEGVHVWEGAIPHWATCKDPEFFRRGRKNSKGLTFPKRRTFR